VSVLEFAINIFPSRFEAGSIVPLDFDQLEWEGHLTSQGKSVYKLAVEIEQCQAVISKKHQEALAYARDGIPVFPCVVNGKHPACPNGFLDATTDEEQINAWWSQADYNLGVCPNDAGWAVIDIDPGGLEPWENLVREFGLPRTCRVRTPRGGAHHYFAGSIASSTSRLAPHVDTRGIGGYVLVPPSSVDGVEYTWEGEEPIAPLPVRITELLQKPAEEPSHAKGEPVSVEHLRGLLRYCGNAETSRNEWRDIVAAIRNTNLSGNDENLDIALAWSRGEYSADHQPPGNYDGDEAVEECFESMPPKTDGVGYGTILHHAREAGYNGPSAMPLETAAEAFGAAKLDKPPTKAERQSLFKPIHIRDFKKHFEEPTWLIPNLLPAKGVVQMTGPRKSFKSFLAMDMALGLASGSTTFGYTPTKIASCVYCVGENANSFALRHVPAWQLARNIESEFPFYVIPRVPRVRVEDEFAELIAQIRAEKIQPQLLVIDTAARMLRGYSMNDDMAVGLASQWLDNLRDEFGCTVMVVRHAGKDLAKGSKGAGEIDNDADTNLFVERHAKSPAVKLTVEDQRNAQEREEPYYFEAQPIPGFSLILKPIEATEFLQYAGQEVLFTRKTIGAMLEVLRVPVTSQVLAEALLPHKDGQGAETRHAAVTRAAGTLNRLASSILQGYWEGHGQARRWSLAPAGNGL
jgi:hypothetical protein